VRQIFIDEAGISAKESVTIVAAVIAIPDLHWRPLQRYQQSLVSKYVPLAKRKGFIIHAKDIFHGSGHWDRSIYPRHARNRLLQEIVASQKEIGFAVSIGCSQRFAEDHSPEKAARMRHLMAYGSCIAGCEAFIRDFGSDGEVAQLVCEDIPYFKQNLLNTHHTIIDKDSDYPAYRELIPFRHIVDTLYFANKQQNALLQFADAFAFLFKRQTDGCDVARDLLAAMPVLTGSAEFGDASGYKISVPVLTNVPTGGVQIS
jgi:hypothetical protein